MKHTKLFGALIALLALGVVACNGGQKESSSSSASTPASSSPAPAPSSSSEAPVPSSSSEAPASSSSDSQAPVAGALFSWSAADLKAGLSNASATEVKDETGDVQFTAYKLGTANDTATFKWTPTADQGGKVSFVLIFTTKSINATNATFWATSSGSEKMSVSVDGNKMAAPDGNPNFQDLAGADGVVDSDVADSGTLANPIEYGLCEFTAVAGQEHTIVVTYYGGGYSFYLCGAKIVKA